MRSLVVLSALAIACSSGAPTQTPPPAFVTVNAPAQVPANADGSYTWHLTLSYTDANDDPVTGMSVTFSTPGGKSAPPTPIPFSQTSVVSQIVDMGFPAMYQGKSYSYAMVLVDQSGQSSAPFTGMVTFQ